MIGSSVGVFAGVGKGSLLERIVVIEDDVDLSCIIRDVLRESNFDVVSYVRPNFDVLEHIRGYRPALVILDARLNASISGWDIITALKEDPEMRDIPLILSSGATREIADHREMLGRYHVPVLEKPFDMDDLNALVERTLVG
jgi:DNA-binding response OmpR family regulator